MYAFISTLKGLRSWDRKNKNYFFKKSTKKNNK